MNGGAPSVDARSPVRRRPPVRVRGGARARCAARRGFSLLELVIVIGIVLILAALVLAVGTGLLVQSEVRQTRAAMALLESAMEEWEQAHGRGFTYGTNGVPTPPAGSGQPAPVYEFQEVVADPGNVAAQKLIVDLLAPERLGGFEGARSILARIDRHLLNQIPNTNPPQTTMVDAWGTPIIVVFPGRPWQAPYDQDASTPRDIEDGTVRTALESRFGVCRNRKVLFVSAGPDGLFGRIGAGPGDGAPSQEELDQAADNVYSYEPGRP